MRSVFVPQNRNRTFFSAGSRELFRYDCGKTIYPASQIRSAAGNDDSTESFRVIQQAASVLSGGSTALLILYWITPVPSVRSG